jgi:hypothetical protein
VSFFQPVAAAVAAIGQMTQGEGQGRAMNIQGDLAQANATNTRATTYANEDTQRRQNTMRMGEVRASAAQSGFDASTGSLATLQTKSAGELELDALTNRYKGQLQAMSFDNEAASLRYGAKAARRQGYLNAAGVLTASAGQAFGAPRIGGLAPVETRIPTPTGRG